MELEDFARVRQMMIDLVLGTDMSQHFKDFNILKGRMLLTDFDPKEKDKLSVLKYAFHLADISNSTKTFEIYK